MKTPPAELSFTVPGEPVGKERPRQGRARDGSRVFYTPKQTKGYEHLVQQCAALAMRGRPPIEGAVEVRLLIVRSVPASWSKKDRERAIAEQILPTTKPDVDNVEKAICDGMNGIVWADDAQVTDVVKCKRYGARPGVGVWVRAMKTEGVAVDPRQWPTP